MSAAPTIQLTNPPAVISPTAPVMRARPSAIREVCLMTALFLGYRQIRFLTRNDTDQALQNAQRVVGFERRIELFHERTLQELAMRSDAVIGLLNHYYVGVHFPLTAAFIVWVLVRHRDWYRPIRNWLIGVTLAALVIHVAFPLAPPRMVSGEGFVDTLRVYGPNIYPKDPNKSVANQFAAMPSLHFGWAVIVACGFIAIRRTRRSLLALLHPLVTLLAIVATANHYWLDAIVALVLVAAGAVLVVRRSTPVDSEMLPAGTTPARAHHMARPTRSLQPGRVPTPACTHPLSAGTTGDGSSRPGYIRCQTPDDHLAIGSPVAQRSPGV